MVQKMRVGGWVAGFTAGLFYIDTAGWHLEQWRRTMPPTQLKGIMRWISPPTAPACRGVLYWSGPCAHEEITVLGHWNISHAAAA